jgi:hypothetical protein
MIIELAIEGEEKGATSVDTNVMLFAGTSLF